MIPPESASTVSATRRGPTRLRRVLGLMMLILLAMPYLIYGYITTDESIRRQATRLLAEMTDGIVTIQSARFSMFSGVTLTGVRIDTPYRAEFAAAGTKPAPREIFSASEVRLQHDPWSLALGRLRVKRITASSPSLTVVYHAESNRYNYNLLFHRPVAPEKGAPRALRPDMLLRSARVTFVRIDEGRETTVPAYTLDADAWAHGSLASAYEFDCRVYGDMPHHVRGMFDPSGHRISETPYVAYASIRQILPRHTRDFLDRFSLIGRFRAKELDYSATAPANRRVEIEFREVSLTMPMPFGSAPSSQPSYSPLTLSAMTGSVELAGSTVHLNLIGRLNGAACRVRGHVDAIDLPFEQLGMDLTMECDRMAFLKGDSRSRLLNDATVPYHLREFFLDFDPHGLVDVRAQLLRHPGPERNLKFLGRLIAVDASAAYRWFRYRLEKLTGEVVFDDDGIHLRNMVGRHDGGTVRVNGVIDSATSWTNVDLQFEGDAVPFDEELHQALSARHRRVWELLSPRGRADARVHLSRQGGSRAHGKGSWQTSLDLELTETGMCFKNLPYALTGVNGTVQMKSDRMTFRDIVGRHGESEVRVDGWADLAVEARPKIEMRVDARGVKLDDDLWNALPPKTHESLAGLGVTGQADIAGSVRLEDPARGVEYDLNATLSDVNLRMRSFPYHLNGVTGRIHITPEEWKLSNLTGRHGAATLSADGLISREPDGASLSLTVHSSKLPLDEALAEALPPRLREVWSSFAPSGIAEATTVIVGRSVNEQITTHYRTRLSIADGRLRYAGFPLDLEHVRAELLLTERRAELLDLEGRPVLPVADSGTASTRPVATVRLNGTFDLGGEAVRGGLRLIAESIPLDDPRVRVALPGLLRDYLEATNARGRADILLDALNLSHTEDGKPRWDAVGRLRLHGVDLDLGVSLHDIHGEIGGTMRAGVKGIDTLDVALDFSSLRVEQWPITSLTARLSQTTPDRILRMNDVAGQAFGGTLTGTAELNLRTAPAAYSMFLTLNDADLAGLLSAEKVSAASQDGVRGRVLGRLSLSGALGNAASREGAGEITLHDAQVWKLPLFLAILRVLNLRPDENAFDDARVQYYVMGSTIHLSRVELYGTALALAGAGTYDTRSDALDLRLAAGTPGPMRVPLLTELMEGAARELIEVRVTGTMSQPKIETQPLRGVKQFLDELFMQPQAEKRR